MTVMVHILRLYCQLELECPEVGIMEVIISELEKVQNNMQKKGWKRSGMSRMTYSSWGTTSAASAALAEAVACVESPLIPWENGDMTRDGVAVSE